MTTEELEATVTALQDNVTTLQNTVQTLTSNLGSINSMYLEALGVLANEINSQTARDAVTTANAGICTSNPPGCHV